MEMGIHIILAMYVGGVDCIFILAEQLIPAEYVEVVANFMESVIIAMGMEKYFVIDVKEKALLTVQIVIVLV